MYNEQIKSNKSAIVIGESITGLLSARVLAEKFTSVTIIERDTFPNQPIVRKGVPQSIQLHTFLVKGYRLLEENFSGIIMKLTEAGACSPVNNSSAINECCFCSSTVI